MRNFKQSNSYGDRGNRGGFSGKNSGRQSMHKATCNECSRECEVPFKPTGSKPVYCSDCFSHKENDQPRRFSGRDPGRFSSSDKKMYKAICDKCDKECEVPFKPSGDKQVYCSSCFGKGDRDKKVDETNKQFEILDDKLTQILKILHGTSPEREDNKSKGKKVSTKKVKAKKTSKSKAKKVSAPKKTKTKKK